MDSGIPLQCVWASGSCSWKERQREAERQTERDRDREGDRLKARTSVSNDELMEDFKLLISSPRQTSYSFP